MITKVVMILFQTYLFYLITIPPESIKSKPSQIYKVEGISGLLLIHLGRHIARLANICLSLFYIFLMYQQEIGNLPILTSFSSRETSYLNFFYEELFKPHKLSEWNLKYIILCFMLILGVMLRLWCFKVMKEFFTFNIEIKKDHKLVTTGPYRLLIHPSVKIYV
ncbi:24587_t:CDS:1 [Dentiscutata erythropus]|uniref:Protein-S-isoprenylcysteine O-methyltransferase n=1 Tax=Dentiscutata erythropus TaxID=1348616 RepID=A0A9N9GCQ8_9GLOM|nr:24587_t:CDS:1 [Dentiscutata erythropus]